MSGVWKTLACGKLKLHFKVTAGSDSSNWKTYVLFWYSYLWLLICLLAEKCTLVFVVAVLVIFVGGGGGGGGGGVCVCACVCVRARARLCCFCLFCFVCFYFRMYIREINDVFLDWENHTLRLAFSCTRIWKRDLSNFPRLKQERPALRVSTRRGMSCKFVAGLMILTLF